MITVMFISRVMLECTLNVRVEQGETLVHELWRRHLFHVDGVVNEHRRVAFDKSLQYSILVWENIDGSLDILSYFLSVKSTITALVIVFSLYQSTDTCCMCLCVGNITDSSLHPDRFLDKLMTKMAISKLLLKLMNHSLVLIFRSIFIKI